MARRSKPKVNNVDDAAKIEAFLKKGKGKKIPQNVSGECVMKSFFARRKKHPFKKSTKQAPPANAK
jgi:hypothetical protein